MRQGLNKITSFIDGSNVYGSEVALAKSLRSLSNGEMTLTDGLLPPPANDQTGCSSASTGNNGQKGCFLAGKLQNFRLILLKLLVVSEVISQVT